MRYRNKLFICLLFIYAPFAMTSANSQTLSRSSRKRTKNRRSRLTALLLIWFLWDVKEPTPLFEKSRKRRPRWCTQTFFGSASITMLGEFLVHSRFARSSSYPWGKMGTTRSLLERDVKDTFLLKVFTSVRVAMVKREKPQIAMFWAECYWGD